MTSNLVTEKIEQAIVEWLRAQPMDFPNENIFAGLSRGVNADESATPEAQNPLPYVRAICEDVEHQAPYSGNWRGLARVEIHSNADDTTRDQHMARAGEIFNLLTTNTIKDDISDALDDFTAHIVIMKTQSHTIQGRRWVSQLGLEIEACGSDIA